MGLCEKHHNEEEKEWHLRKDAVNALHHKKVDGGYIQNKVLKEEMQKIQKWWTRGCNALNNNREDKTLRDETEASNEWCIALSKEIIKAEREYRIEGEYSHSMLVETKSWVWERINNLESGLMSNGNKRPNE